MRDIVSDEDEPCREKGRVPQYLQKRGLPWARLPVRREVLKMAPHHLRLRSYRAGAPEQTRLANVYEFTASRSP